MKKLNVNFTNTEDTTGYLFSLAKCLSASLRCSRFNSYADDIVASSAFAFRMWVAPNDLCPSSTSIWEFKMQKPWVENGGLICDYVERLWGEETLEESRRLEAVEVIKESIDNGVAAVAWDISGCEWGIIIGYDDGTDTFCTLKINGGEDSIPYDKLGRLDLPIMSVLTVADESRKTAEQLVADTKKLALSHLKGEEWCDNAKGLAAYDALIDFVETKLGADTAWNLEYCLGTYAALKWYGWRFFEKYGERELARLYKDVHEAWQTAFETKCSSDVTDPDVKKKISDLLRKAKEAETNAIEILAK